MRRSKISDASAGSFRDVPGVIVRDAFYRADEVKARMGWKDSAFRAACRSGLAIHRVGKRVYVTGVDLMAYITKGGAQS